MKLTLLYSGNIQIRNLEDKSSFLHIKSKAGQLKERHCEFYRCNPNLLQVSLFKVKHKIPEILSYHRFELTHELANYPFVGYMDGKCYFFFKDHPEVHFFFATEAECEHVLSAIFPKSIPNDESNYNIMVPEHNEVQHDDKEHEEQHDDEAHGDSMNFGDCGTISHDVDEFLGLKPENSNAPKIEVLQLRTNHQPTEAAQRNNSPAAALQSPRREDPPVSSNNETHLMDTSDMSISSQPLSSLPPTRKTYVDRHQFGQIGADHEPVRRKHRGADKVVDNADLQLSLPTLSDPHDTKTSNPPSRSVLLASTSLDHSHYLHSTSMDLNDFHFDMPQTSSSSSADHQLHQPPRQPQPPPPPSQQHTQQSYSSPLRSQKPHPAVSPPREPTEFRIADLMLKSTPDHLNLSVTELNQPSEQFAGSGSSNNNNSNNAAHPPVRLGERKSHQRVNVSLPAHSLEGYNSSTNNSNVLQNEIQALTMMNNQLNLAIEQSDEQHKEEMDAAFHELARLRNALDQSEQEKQDLINEFQDAIKMKESVVQVTSEFDKVFTLLSTLQKENEQMQHEKAQQDIELQRLHQSEAALTQQVQQLHIDLEDKALQLSVHEQALHTNQQHLGQSSTELARKDKNLEMATNRILELKQAVHELETANRTLREQVIDYDSLLISSKTQHDRIQLLENTSKHLELDLTAAKMTEESHKLTISRLESLITEQQHFVTELSEKIKFLEDMKDKHNEAHMQLVICQDEKTRITMEKESLEREYIRMKAHSEAVEEDRRSRLREYEALLVTKTTDLDTARSQLSKAVMDADCLQQEISLLQLRIEHQKDQTQKVTDGEQQLQRRLQLEQQSATNQIQALKQSLEQQVQTNVDMTAQLHQVEEKLRIDQREAQQQISSLEDVNASLRRTSQDMTSRLYLLEEQHHAVQQQYHELYSQHKLYQEETHVQLTQHQHDKKLQTTQIQELSEKLIECQSRLKQKEDALKNSETRRAEDQHNVANTLQELQQKIDVYQQRHHKAQEEYQTLLDERKAERKAHEDLHLANQQQILSLTQHLAEMTKKMDILESQKSVESQRHLALYSELENQLLTERSLHLELQHQHKAVEDLLHLEKKTHLDLQRLHRELTLQQQYHEDKKQQIEAEYLGYADNMQKKVKTLESSLTEKNLEFTALHRRHTEYESNAMAQITTLSQRTQVLEDSLLQSSTALKETQVQRDHLEKVVMEKIAELHTLSLSQQTQDFHVQELQRTVNIQQEKLSALQADVDLKVQMLKAAELREAQLVDDGQQAARQAHAATQRLQQVQAELEVKGKHISALTHTLTETEQHHIAVQQALQQVQQHYDVVHIELQQKTREVDFQQKQLASLQQDNERKSNELHEQQQRRVQQWEDQEAQFLLSTGKKDSEIQQLQDSLQLQSTELRKTTQWYEKEQEKNKDLAVQILSLKAAMLDMVLKSEVEAEKEALQSQLQSATQQSHLISSQSHAATLRIQSLEKQVQQYKVYLDRVFSLPSFGAVMTTDSSNVDQEDNNSSSNSSSMVASSSSSPSKRLSNKSTDKKTSSSSSEAMYYAEACKRWEREIVIAQDLLSSQAGFIQEITAVLQQSQLAAQSASSSHSNNNNDLSMLSSIPQSQPPLLSNTKDIFKTVVAALKRDVRQASHLSFDYSIHIDGQDSTAEDDFVTSNQRLLATCQNSIQRYLQTLLNEVNTLQERYQALDQQEKDTDNQLQEAIHELEECHDQVKSLQDAIEAMKHKHEQEVAEKVQAVQDKQSELENMQAFYNDREQQVATVYAENIENQKVEYKEALHGAKEEFATLLNEKADEIRDLLAAVKDKEMQCTRVSRAGQDKEYEIRRLQDEIELLQDKLRLKGEQCAEASNQIATLELKMAQEIRQRMELDRALRKQINIDRNSVQPTPASISTIRYDRSSPEKKEVTPQPSKLLSVGTTSRQQGLLRSLSAQRRLPSATSASHVKEDTSFNSHRKSSNPSERFEVSKASHATNASSSSLVSDETKRSLQDLIRLKNSALPKANYIPQPAASFHTERSFQDDSSVDDSESKSYLEKRSIAASPGRSMTLHDL